MAFTAQLNGQTLYRTPDLDDHHGVGQAWILPNVQKTNAYNPQGQVFYGSPETGFTPARTREDDGSQGDPIYDMGNMLDVQGRPIYGSKGRSDDSFGAQVGGTLMTNPTYMSALQRAGVTPRYDPEWGWVIDGNSFNRVNDIYMQSIGGGIYGDKGGWINQMLDAGVPLQIMMGAIAGPAIGEAGAAAGEAFGAGVETAAEAGAGATSGLQVTGMLPATTALSEAAQFATKNALTSGLTAAMSGKDPFEAAIKGGAFSMLGGSIANSLVSEGVNSTIANTVSQAVVQEVRNGSINPESLLTGAASNVLSPEVSKIFKNYGIPESMMPTITKAVNQAIMTGEVDPKKLFSSMALNAINSGSKTATEAASGAVTPNEIAATITDDQGRTGNNAIFYDEQGNALDASGEPVTPPEEPVGCQPPFIDDGTGRCILPEDKAAEDKPTPDCGPGMAFSLATNSCVPVDDMTNPVTTTVTPKTPGSTGTTGGTGTTGVPTKPPVTAPAVNSGQTQQNQQNALLMGLLLGEGQQAPQQQQQPVLAKIGKAYDFEEADPLGGQKAIKATDPTFYAGGSVHGINDELLKMLRS